MCDMWVCDMVVGVRHEGGTSLTEPRVKGSGHAMLRRELMLTRAARYGLAPFARGIVIGIWSLLRRAQGFRDVAEVDTNAGPRGRAAAHGIDKDIVYGEQCGGLGMFVLPPFQTFERGPSVGGVGHDDEWHLCSGRAGAWRLCAA
jgi:hypothetical protein